MELAVIFNRPQVLRQLFALGYKLDMRTYEQETLLHLAAKLGQAESVDALLSCGVDPNILSGHEGASSDQNPPS
jgi:ankyrin repeat protein